LADGSESVFTGMGAMIDPDHSMFRTYREDNSGIRMAHIPYYGEDANNLDNKKDARDVKKPRR